MKFKTQQLLPPYSDIHALVEIQTGQLIVFLSSSTSTKKAHYPTVFLCSGPEVFLWELVRNEKFWKLPQTSESDTLELESIPIDVLRFSPGNSDARQILGIDALV